MTAFAVPANLAFDDYSSLKTFIADWMDRSDLTGSVPSMIALCEARLRRELSPLFSETTAGVTVTSGVGSLPADCDVVRGVFYTSGGNTFELPQVDPTRGRTMVSGSIPVAYTLEAGGIYLWPSTTATVSLVYQPKLPRLSDSNATNTLLGEHPDVYFYGSMLFAEGYVANDSRAALFKSLWDEAIQEARRFFTKQRLGTPLSPRVAWLP